MGTVDSKDESARKYIHVAIIGQTGVGKGSLINAIRGIDSKFRENTADVTHGVLPGSLVIKKYGYPDNDNPIIYFYDTGGFGDAYNYKYYLEEWLKKYQSDNIVKFDAIIFMFNSSRFTKDYIKPLKDQDNKDLLVLYVVNQIDILKLRIDNDDVFENAKKKIKEDILDILKNKGVNKNRYSDRNIYLITSKASKFENKDVSPDGIRLKSDLEFLHFLKLKYKF